jgi:hypothetical protein
MTATDLSARLPMKELARRINAHLRRIEADPKINVVRNSLHKFYYAGAHYSGGARIRVTYITYQGSPALSRSEAERYLAALDSGSTDLHSEVLRG